MALKNKRQFANWIKQRISQYGFTENVEFIRFNNSVKADKNGHGNKTLHEYYLTINMAKELCKISKYFNNYFGK